MYYSLSTGNATWTLESLLVYMTDSFCSNQSMSFIPSAYLVRAPAAHEHGFLKKQATVPPSGRYAQSTNIWNLAACRWNLRIDLVETRTMQRRGRQHCRLSYRSLIRGYGGRIGVTVMSLNVTAVSCCFFFAACVFEMIIILANLGYSRRVSSTASRTHCQPSHLHIMVHFAVWEYPIAAELTNGAKWADTFN